MLNINAGHVITLGRPIFSTKMYSYFFLFLHKIASCVYSLVESVLMLQCIHKIYPKIWEGVVGCGKGVVYLTSPGGSPTDIGLQLGKACYPSILTYCSRETPKRVIGKQCRSDAADQGLHCLQILQPFLLGISKSHSLMYLKLKLDSSNI